MPRIGTVCPKCQVVTAKGTLNCPRCGALTVVGLLPKRPKKIRPEYE